MARKTTIITTITGGGGGGGTTLVLGAIGVVAGILAIDHHFSKKGTSKFDRLRSGSFFTGFDAPWAELGAQVKSQPMQDWMKQVIQKAVDTESAQTLQQLAANLAAAGLHQIADAVRAAGQKK
jgi:hypothetical protein